MTCTPKPSEPDTECSRMIPGVSLIKDAPENIRFKQASKIVLIEGRSIQFTTINMFKGLEADIVFVVACEEHEGEAISEILYAQGSRARTLLYVYYK